MKTTITTRRIGLGFGLLLTSSVLWSCDDSIEGDFGDPVASVENSGSSSTQSTYEPAAATVVEGNAAPHYQRAWDGITDEMGALVNSVNFDTIHYGGWRAPEGLSLGSYEDDLNVDLLIKASGYRSADFGIVYDQGPLTELPHLSLMRTSVRIMLLTARLRLDAGDEKGAVETMVAAYRMSMHEKNEAVIISSLFSKANFHTINQLVMYADRAGALDTDARAALRDAIGPFRGDDAFGIKASIGSELKSMLGWVRGRLTQGDRQAVQNLLSMVMSESRQFQKVQALQEAITRGDDLLPDLQSWETFHTRALEAWDKPGAKKKLTELYAQASDGTFGQFAQVLGLAFPNMYRQASEGEQLVANILETLSN